MGRVENILKKKADALSAPASASDRVEQILKKHGAELLVRPVKEAVQVELPALRKPTANNSGVETSVLQGMNMDALRQAGGAIYEAQTGKSAADVTPWTPSAAAQRMVTEKENPELQLSLQPIREYETYSKISGEELHGRLYDMLQEIKVQQSAGADTTELQASASRMEEVLQQKLGQYSAGDLIQLQGMVQSQWQKRADNHAMWKKRYDNTGRSLSDDPDYDTYSTVFSYEQGKANDLKERLRAAYMQKELGADHGLIGKGDFFDRLDKINQAGIMGSMGQMNALWDKAQDIVVNGEVKLIELTAKIYGKGSPLYSSLMDMAEKMRAGAAKPSRDAVELTEAADKLRTEALAGTGLIDGFIVQQMENVSSMMFDIWVAGAGGMLSGTTGTAMAPKSSTQLALRATGGGIQEAQEKGYGEIEQILYGTAVGALEWGSEQLFGGNPLYDEGKGLVPKLVEKVTDNPKILRALYSKPFGVLGEGFEEVFVEFTTPTAEYVFTSKDEIDWASPEDLAAAFAGGVFLGLIGTGVEMTTNAIGNAKTVKAYNALGDLTVQVGAVQSVIDKGLQADPITDAYQNAVKLQKKLDAGMNITAKDMGKQLIANQEAIDAGKLVDIEEVEDDPTVPEGKLQDPEDGFYAVAIGKQGNKNTYRLVQVHSDGSVEQLTVEGTESLFGVKIAAEIQGIRVRHIGTVQNLTQIAEAKNKAAEEATVTSADNGIATPDDTAVKAESSELQWAGSEIATPSAEARNDTEVETAAEDNGLRWAGNMSKVEEVDPLEQLRRDYAEGRITEEEFDEALELIRQEESAAEQSMVEGVQWAGSETEENGLPRRFAPRNDRVEETAAKNNNTETEDMTYGTEQTNEISDRNTERTGERSGERSGGRTKNNALRAATRRAEKAYHLRNAVRRAGVERTSLRGEGLLNGSDVENLMRVPEELWTDELRLANKAAEEAGLELVPLVGILRVNMNGKEYRVTAVICGGKIYAQADSVSMDIMEAVRHEIFNDKAERSPELVKGLMKQIAMRYSDGELQQLFGKYYDLYKDILPEDMDETDVKEYIWEEMLADAYAGYQRYPDHAEPATWVEEVREVVERMETKNTAKGGVDTPRFSISEKLKTELETVRNGTYNAHRGEIYIGETSNFLTTEIGADGISMSMPPSKAYAAMVSEEEAMAAGRYDDSLNYHSLGEKGVVDALVASETPVAAFVATDDEFGSRGDRVILVTDRKKNNGAIIVILEMSAPARVNGKRIIANKVISVYERTRIVKDILDASSQKRLLALDKKRSQAILAGRSGSNPLMAIQEADFKKNIQNFWANVKWLKSGETEYSVGGENTETPMAIALRKAQEKKNEEGRLSIATGGDIATDDLPAKAQSYLRRVEWNLVQTIGEQMDISFTQRRGGLRDAVQKLSQEYLQNGDVSQQTVDMLFGAASSGRYDNDVDVREKFETAVYDALEDLRQVKRYADYRAEETAETAPLTQEDVKRLYTELKTARSTAEKAVAKNLLTAEDEAQIGKLLRGEASVESLDAEKYNVKGIKAVYEARAEYERIAKQIRQWNQSRKAQLRQQADEYLQTANDWQDKSAGLLYARETMERNIRDIVKEPELAQKIIEAYFEPVHRANAEANKLKTYYRNEVRTLELSRKVEKGNTVSEAHAVQLLGEAEDNIRMLEQSKGRMKQRDGKTLDEWRSVVQTLWESNPNMNEAKIRAAVQSFREIYDSLFEQMNEVRIRNGYEPVNYRNGYFPHFQPGDGGIMALFGKALGIDTQVNALPTTINGLTHTFRPGITWFGNAQERLGFNTAYDAVEGFDKYIEGVADVIFHTDNIQRLRALASQIRYRTGDEGIRKQVDAVMADTTLSEQDKQNRIEKIYETGKYSLSNFVVELEEYTNLLANKKSRHDRSVEGDVGRKIYTIVKNLESRVAANMVAVNPASWLTNFIPLTQGGASLERGMLLRGMWNTLRAGKENDGLVDMSSFLTNRRGSDPIVKTWQQSASEKMSAPMEYIDQFVADSLVRARYYQNLKHDMSEDAAMREADAWVAGVMADRSKGSMPTLFGRKNPLVKLLTQFQLEANNQLSYVMKDIPRDMRAKGAAALVAALIKFCLGAFLFDEVYEFFIGRRPALDPLGILNDTVGDITGYELPNLVEMGVGAIKGEKLDFKTEKEGVYGAASGLLGNIAEGVPFVGGLLGGGRIPISSAMPDGENLLNAALNSEWDSEKRWRTAAKEIGGSAAYLIPPFGGGQVKKIVETVQAIHNHGSYNAGGNLQYPVFADSGVDWAGSAIIGSVFGKSSLPTAREWVESDFKGLNETYTQVYETMLQIGETDRKAWEVTKQLADAEKAEESSVATVRRQILREADISGNAKLAVYYAICANDDELGLIESLDEEDPQALFETLNEMRSAEKTGDQSETEIRRQCLQQSDVSDETKLAIYKALCANEKEVELLEDLSEVEPDVLYEVISGIKDADKNTDKLITLFKSDLDEESMLSALAYISDTESEKLAAASDYVDCDLYGKFLQSYFREYGYEDKNQERVEDILNHIPGLSDKERAALWQVCGKRWKPKNNPYSVTVGQKIYDALN